MSALWVPLSVNFPQDPRVLDCSPLAQLVYVRGLCLSKQTASNGFLSAKQTDLLCYDLLQQTETVASFCQELVASGLWIEQADGYAIRSWLKYNKSRAEVEKLTETRRESGRRGGVAKAKQVARTRSSKPLAEVEKRRGREEVEVEVEKEPSRGTSIERSDPEPRRLAELLASLVAKNGSKRPTNLDAWTDDIEKLIRIDGRAPDQVESVIRWCQQDSFWQANILSGAKLRAKYDQLNLKRTATGNGRANNNRDSLTSAAETFLGVR